MNKTHAFQCYFCGSKLEFSNDELLEHGFRVHCTHCGRTLIAPSIPEEFVQNEAMGEAGQEQLRQMEETHEKLALIGDSLEHQKESEPSEEPESDKHSLSFEDFEVAFTNESQRLEKVEELIEQDRKHHLNQSLQQESDFETLKEEEEDKTQDEPEEFPFSFQSKEEAFEPEEDELTKGDELSFEAQKNPWQASIPKPGLINVPSHLERNPLGFRLRYLEKSALGVDRNKLLGLPKTVSDVIQRLDKEEPYEDQYRIPFEKIAPPKEILQPEPPEQEQSQQLEEESAQLFLSEVDSDFLDSESLDELLLSEALEEEPLEEEEQEPLEEEPLGEEPLEEVSLEETAPQKLDATAPLGAVKPDMPIFLSAPEEEIPSFDEYLEDMDEKEAVEEEDSEVFKESFFDEAEFLKTQEKSISHELPIQLGDTDSLAQTLPSLSETTLQKEVDEPYFQEAEEDSFQLEKEEASLGLEIDDDLARLSAWRTVNQISLGKEEELPRKDFDTFEYPKTQETKFDTSERMFFDDDSIDNTEEFNTSQKKFPVPLGISSSPKDEVETIENQSLITKNLELDDEEPFQTNEFQEHEPIFDATKTDENLTQTSLPFLGEVSTEHERRSLEDALFNLEKDLETLDEDEGSFKEETRTFEHPELTQTQATEDEVATVSVPSNSLAQRSQFLQDFFQENFQVKKSQTTSRLAESETIQTTPQDFSFEKDAGIGKFQDTSFLSQNSLDEDFTKINSSPFHLSTKEPKEGSHETEVVEGFGPPVYQTGVGFEQRVSGERWGDTQNATLLQEPVFEKEEEAHHEEVEPLVHEQTYHPPFSTLQQNEEPLAYEQEGFRPREEYQSDNPLSGTKVETSAFAQEPMGMTQNPQAPPYQQGAGFYPPMPNPMPFGMGCVYTPSVVYIHNGSPASSGFRASNGNSLLTRKDLLPGHELHLPVRKRRHSRSRSHAILWFFGVLFFAMLAFVQLRLLFDF